VHVPAELTWAHEHAEPGVHHRERLFEVATIAEVLQVVAGSESCAPRG
jgi:hypothetical protein